MNRRPSAVFPIGLLGALLVSASAVHAQVSLSAAPLAGVPTNADLTAPEPAEEEKGLGLSGKLRVAVVQALDALDLPFVTREERTGEYRWVPLFANRTGGLLGTPLYRSGLRAPSTAGVWRLDDGDAGVEDLTLVTRVPFSEKKNGYLNGYHIGRYPTEGSGRTDRYAPPAGFIEVTLENQDLQISEHFRLRDFLTKDQHNVWPKYVALDLRLIDKLELVLQELNAMGIRAEHMVVMSGFRTPQYNGPGTGGRAKLSRHTYGDAADVWVDSDGDWYMDDLNGDGRRDMDDAAVMRRAVDRVEARYPDLVGGNGLYPDNGVHGPFIHIDVRGSPARW
jgi:uncharacterized protein YcbK (DUF882 family)